MNFFKKILNLLIVFLLLFCFIPSFARAYTEPKPIIFYGDSQVGQSEKGDQIYQQIADDILIQNAGIVFHLGDLVNYKDDVNGWAMFDFITASIRASSRFLPAIGNHDAYTGYFPLRFSLPRGGRYYSTTYGRLYLIVLDSNADFKYDTYQYNWLKGSLIRARSLNKTTIIIFHHPPIASGGGVDNTKQLIPLFEKYRVRMVFNGHYHSYERSYFNHIHYLICGGAGATLYPPEGPINIYSRKYLKSYNFCRLDLHKSEMKLSVYDQNLNLIDSGRMSY
jgi:3',5'-cyclic AMP phosphodiesterase CpdA